MSETKKQADKAEVVPVAEQAIYTPSKGLSVPVRFDENGEVWMTQDEIATLFGCTQENVSIHLTNAEAEELAGIATYKKFLCVAKDGKSRIVKHYGLDAVLSVGYRVKSAAGVAFRRWANGVLHERLRKEIEARARALYDHDAAWSNLLGASRLMLAESDPSAEQVQRLREIYDELPRALSRCGSVVEQMIKKTDKRRREIRRFLNRNGHSEK